MRILQRTAVALATVGVLGMASTAQAQVTFTGTTIGCFYTGTVCTPAVGGATLAGLTFHDGSFSGTTADNFLGIGGSGSDFGTFDLASTPSSYSGNFRLEFNFSAPPNAGVPFVTAMLNGTVQSTSTGGVHFAFQNPSQWVSYDGGKFLLAVDNFTIEGGKMGVPITGTITTTPEPSSIVLLTSGLFGLIPVASRRRKA